MLPVRVRVNLNPASHPLQQTRMEKRMYLIEPRYNGPQMYYSIGHYTPLGDWVENDITGSESTALMIATKYNRTLQFPEG